MVLTVSSTFKGRSGYFVVIRRFLQFLGEQFRFAALPFVGKCPIGKTDRCIIRWATQKD